MKTIDQLADALRVARAHLDAIATGAVPAEDVRRVARIAYDGTTPAIDAYDTDRTNEFTIDLASPNAPIPGEEGYRAPA